MAKAQTKMKSNVFQNPSELITGFENFGGSSVGCLKITEDKVLDTDLTKREGHSQLRRKPHVRRENGSQPKRGCHHIENTRLTFKG